MSSQFSIGKQVRKELEKYKTQKLRLARGSQNDAEFVRMAVAKRSGYDFNTLETIELIDLYYASQFESGAYDQQKQRRIFLNIGKFRTNVASKQIRTPVKDFRFIPDDFADPFSAYFMQKDFKDWAQEHDFADTIALWEDKLPRYGTIVAKKIGSEIVDLPLQNIAAIQQDAESIQEASHFIEKHPKMRIWEMQLMSSWDITGLQMDYDDELDVFERSGHVPVEWLRQQKGATDPSVVGKKDGEYVDARVIVCYPKNDRTKEAHVLFAEMLSDDRGYREAHWERQHGRWLGIGIMEDQFENQRAKNTSINLIKRSMQWSAKRILQSQNGELSEKNLVADVPDGAILEVGPNGDIREVPLSARTNADFSVFMNEFEKNADQKAFTYEAGLAGMGNSRTAFRLGALLTQAAQAYFDRKKAVLRSFVKETVEDFLIEQFIKDMGNKERVISLLEGDSGFSLLKAAAMDFMRTEVTRVSLLSGTPIDAHSLAQAVSPVEALKQMFFKIQQGGYKLVRCKFDFVSTDDDTVDTEQIVKNLTMLYQTLAQRGDPRAEYVLQRLAAVGGTFLPTSDTFGAPPAANPGAGAPGAEDTQPEAGGPMLKNAAAASGFPTKVGA